MAINVSFNSVVDAFEAQRKREEAERRLLFRAVNEAWDLIFDAWVSFAPDDEWQDSAQKWRDERWAPLVVGRVLGGKAKEPTQEDPP